MAITVTAAPDGTLSPQHSPDGASQPATVVYNETPPPKLIGAAGGGPVSDLCLEWAEVRRLA